METKQPTEEQLREFWEGCGLTRLPVGNKHYHFEHTAKVMDWQYPDRTVHPFLPNPDLNSLFKFAFPIAVAKLESRFDTKIKLRRGLALLFEKWKDRMSEDYSVEDALFWAIREVMKDG